MQLPSLKNRKPTPIKRKITKFSLLLHWLKSGSSKRRRAIGCSVLGVPVLFLIVGRLMHNPKAQLETAPKSEIEMLSQFSDVRSPLAFTGLEDGELAKLPVSEQVAIIYKGLDQFDGWLSRKTDASVYALMTHEASRLKAAAEKEVKSGKIDTTDKTRTFQVSECIATIQPVDCVLLRYVGDGIDQMSESSRKKDVYGYSSGLLKARSAMIALSIKDVKEPDSKTVISGLINYRMVMERLITITPAGQRLPTDEVLAPIGDKSPGEAFQEKYPNDKEVR